MQRVFKGLTRLRGVITLIWTDADGFVRLRLAGVVALVMAASAVTALGPVALKLVVDAFASGGRGTSVSLLVFLYVLTQWFARIVGEIRGLLYARAERRMSRMLGERLFSHVMQLPLRFHLGRRTGAIGQTLEYGVLGYQLVLHTLVFSLLPVGTELGTIVAVLARMDEPMFLLLFVAALVAYAGAFASAAMTVGPSAHAAAAAQIDAHAVMTDSLLNYETVKYFAAENVVQARAALALAAAETGWVAYYRRFALNGLAVAAIFSAFLAVTLLRAAHEVQAGLMTVGTFVLISSYMLQVVRPVELFGYALQSLSQGVAFLEEALALLREPPEPAFRPSSVRPSVRPTDSGSVVSGSVVSGSTGRRSAGDGLADNGPAVGATVDFQDVRLAYRPGHPVLKGVTFSMQAGSTVALVGSSGAGKSSIVRLMVRLLEPDGGRILLDGVPLGEYALSALRRQVAIVPQDSMLFDESIAGNIGFGDPGCSQDDIQGAARLAQLHDFVMSLPQGYETRVGERGVRLSGGERQRVSIARAALRKPRVYVFDEATSSLDSVTEGEIVRNLREIARLGTTLVIAHRLSTVVHADEILVLEKGVIVERGTHVSLLERNGRYASLWNAQQRSTQGSS
ncbi:MAG TPA: ABC transporter ATP-binding protein [Steroidobacteraceae bacterium]|nr:ABC transporter ATP-binding protein [Steroidobacteraceae bacterium]